MDKFNVEFHCHTEYSRDCLVSVRELIATARQVGLQRLVITDHNTIEGALRARELAPDLVIVGEEILTTRGELLACFVTEEIPKYIDPFEAIARLREQGAFISVSHPFDLRRHGWRLADLERITPLVDAIEVFNSRCQVNFLNEQAERYARQHNLAGTVGSDAHTLAEVGRSRLELDAFDSADGLRVVIRQGQAQTRLSSPFIHLSSTYARIVKEMRKRHENSPDRSVQEE